VQVTINGTNDAPVAVGDTGAVSEDGTLVASGTVTATDVDISDTHTFAVQGTGVGTYGSITLDANTGVWSYALDNTSNAVQDLNGGQIETDQFIFEVDDGNGGTDTSTISVDVAGADDGPAWVDGVFNAAFAAGSYDPWNAGTYTSSMDTVFGAGEWDHFNNNNTNIFDDGYDFIWIDGGDGSTSWFQNYVNTFRTEMETYVNEGGTLLLNAGRWGGTNGFDLGFGVDLNVDASSRVYSTVDATALENGPNGYAGTTWTGNSFSHDTVSGAGITSLLIDNTGGHTVLGEMDFGDGHVLLGGMTAARFHDPDPQSEILETNILDYAASFADDYVFL
jgi:VCBS repeat-containing protein